MIANLAHETTLAPSLDEQVLMIMSDDECVERLALAIERHDDSKFGELAQLLGRLAVPIE